MNTNPDNMLDLAAQPLCPDDLQRLRQLVDRTRNGGVGFVGLYSPTRRVCIAGTAGDGKLIAWTMFPAEDEESAYTAAQALHRVVEFSLDRSIRPAAAAIDKARRMS